MAEGAHGLAALSERQRALLDAWIPGFVVDVDHSWGLIATTVLEVRQGGERYVVKAGGESDHHIGRELRAHREWLSPWTSIGRAPALVHGDSDAKLLVTQYLPGELVQGDPAQDDPDTYRQAGELLALLHGQGGTEDPGYEAGLAENASKWLAGPHRIPADVVARLRAEIDSWPLAPSVIVPTHGDWQPRNWLVHEGTVFAIDLGRADLRPALSDLSRLAVQDFRRDPRLEAAFLDGYGAGPREPGAWRRNLVREAIGAAAWAYQVGDEAFEAQGHRMIADVLRTASS